MMRIGWVVAFWLLAFSAGNLWAGPPPLEKLFGGPFSLIDQEGRVRTDQDFRGRFMLLYFGYSYCPDICPTDLANMAAALDLLGEDGSKVTPIFVTVDPDRDSPPLLQEYLAHFGPEFVGLTGDEQAVASIAKAYRVHRVKVISDPTHPEDYLVSHSPSLYLMGPDGIFRTLIPHGADASLIAARLKPYLAGAAAAG